jgi:hypothetical protein
LRKLVLLLWLTVRSKQSSSREINLQGQAWLSVSSARPRFYSKNNRLDDSQMRWRSRSSTHVVAYRAKKLRVKYIVFNFDPATGAQPRWLGCNVPCPLKVYWKLLILKHTRRMVSIPKESSELS